MDGEAKDFMMDLIMDLLDSRKRFEIAKEVLDDENMIEISDSEKYVSESFLNMISQRKIHIELGQTVN